MVLEGPDVAQNIAAGDEFINENSLKNIKVEYLSPEDVEIIEDFCNNIKNIKIFRISKPEEKVDDKSLKKIEIQDSKFHSKEESLFGIRIFQESTSRKLSKM